MLYTLYIFFVFDNLLMALIHTYQDKILVITSKPSWALYYVIIKDIISEPFIFSSKYMASSANRNVSDFTFSGKSFL